MQGPQEVLTQLPKRKQKLRGHAREHGWGLYFEQGWDLRKMAKLYFLVVGLGSLLFALLWTVLQKDIQSAFAIASWMVTLGGSVLALFAMYSSGV
jgi:hypothetical protein